MLAEDSAVRTDVEQRIVDRRPATLGIHLVDADGHGDAPRPGRLAELLRRIAWNRHGVREELRIRFPQRVRVTGGDEPDPERIPRDERLGEHGELPARSPNLGNQAAGLGDRRLPIHVDRARLNGSDLERVAQQGLPGRVLLLYAHRVPAMLHAAYISAESAGPSTALGRCVGDTKRGRRRSREAANVPSLSSAA